MRRFGDVTVARARTSAEMRRLLVDPILESDILIVKPNWFAPHPANFTNADALRMLLEAVDSRVVVTEAYTLERQDGSMRFTVDGEEVDWMWILEHPDWGWAKEEGRWEEIRRQDRWFLDEHGFSDLFEEFGVEYVNVTEEVWRGRTADPEAVREAVEERFAPAFTERLYGFLPRRLHDLRGSTMISLGKVKGIGGAYPSLTVKNMFGLIPDPLRVWWHGPNNSRLDRSIVDITKLYASYFSLYGVNEAAKTLVATDPEGEVKAPWGRYSVKPGHGLVVHGPNLLELDAVTCGLIDVDPGRVGYLQRGEEVFNTYSVDDIKRAESLRRHYLHL